MTLGLGQWPELGDDKLLVRLPGVGVKDLTEVKVIIDETARHESGRIVTPAPGSPSRCVADA